MLAGGTERLFFFPAWAEWEEGEKNEEVEEVVVKGKVRS